MHIISTLLFEAPARNIPLEFPYNAHLVSAQAFILACKLHGRHNALLMVGNHNKSWDALQEWVRAARFKHVFSTNSYRAYPKEIEQ